MHALYYVHVLTVWLYTM